MSDQKVVLAIGVLNVIGSHGEVIDMRKCNLNWIISRIDEIKEEIEDCITYDVDVPLSTILATIDEANKYWGESIKELKTRWGG